MIVEFYDMNSGGMQKTDYPLIWIEADSREEGTRIFKKVFNRSPYHVTCDGCGEDFVISELEGTYEYLKKTKAGLSNYLDGEELKFIPKEG